MFVLGTRDNAVSHVGLVRSGNQDAYCCRSSAGVWVVADGVGGHHGGERASAAIIEAIENLPEHSTFSQRLTSVREAIAEANRIIFEEADLTGRRMGATVVALVIGEGRYAVLWAGDSRAYLKRDEYFFGLTRDHTQAQELVAAGLLASNAVEGHPSSNILVRAVGVLPSLELEETDGQIAENDLFLLCSDGLHNLVSDAEMAELIDVCEFNRVSQNLVELGLERGAPDNITVCVVSMDNEDTTNRISFGRFL
jgi:serine/threonine protein phosphatase Stp1